MPAIVAQTSVLVAILAWNACDIAAQSIPLGTSTVPKPNCRAQVAMLVSAGAYHTCARNWSLSDRSTSGIACWGWNEFGQASPQPKLLLQNLQQAGAHLTALQVAADAFEGTCPALGTNLCYDAVASGPRHTCAIASARQVSLCRGGKDDGLICDASHSCLAGECVDINIRAQDTAARVPGANVYCWGSDAYGQAPPNLAARLSPVQLGASCCDEAGGNHCQCRVTDVAVWREEAGVGQWELRQRPVAVCTGGMHTCVLWANNRVSCFGCRGCLHNQTAVPPEIQGDAKAISCGLRHTCALLRTSGGIVCWGENQHGQAAAPVLVGAKQVSAGALHTCCVAANSSLVCWGANMHGQSSHPVSSGYVAVSAGLTFTCALRSTTGTDNFGRIECFGHLFSSSSSWSARSPPSPAPSPQKQQVGAAQVTPGTAASRPSVPDSLRKRDMLSVHVGHAHVCVTDAVDLSLNCYAVGGPATIRAAAADTASGSMPRCINPCALCSDDRANSAPSLRGDALAQHFALALSLLTISAVFLVLY